MEDDCSTSKFAVFLLIIGEFYNLWEPHENFSKIFFLLKIFVSWLNQIGKRRQYNNNVYFKGVRFIFGPNLAIIGPSEARADLMAR